MSEKTTSPSRIIKMNYSVNQGGLKSHSHEACPRLNGEQTEHIY